jgi:hypothetical protein
MHNSSQQQRPATCSGTKGERRNSLTEALLPPAMDARSNHSAHALNTSGHHHALNTSSHALNASGHALNTSHHTHASHAGLNNSSLTSAHSTSQGLNNSMSNSGLAWRVQKNRAEMVTDAVDNVQQIKNDERRNLSSREDGIPTKAELSVMGGGSREDNLNVLDSGSDEDDEVVYCNSRNGKNGNANRGFQGKTLKEYGFLQDDGNQKFNHANTQMVNSQQHLQSAALSSSAVNRLSTASGAFGKRHRGSPAHQLQEMHQMAREMQESKPGNNNNNNNQSSPQDAFNGGFNGGHSASASTTIDQDFSASASATTSVEFSATVSATDGGAFSGTDHVFSASDAAAFSASDSHSGSGTASGATTGAGPSPAEQSSGRPSPTETGTSSGK